MDSNQLVISTRLLRHFYIGPYKHFRVPFGSYPDWSLLCAEEGAYTYSVDDIGGEAGPGDIILVPPHAVLHRKSHTPMLAHFFVFKWLDRDGSERTDAAGIPCGKITIRDMSRLSTTYKYLRKIGDSYGGEEHDFVNHLLGDLLYLYRGEIESSRSLLSKDLLMNEAASYIRKHAYGSLTMQKVANVVGMSQSQFTRRFKSVIGMLPVVYLTRTRLQKARDLLLDTDHTLDYIADQCGYQNGFYLSRVFVKVMKMSPSEYRKAHRI